MADGAGFTTAITTLSAATGADDDLCTPLSVWFGGTGVAISTLGDPLGSETICATDPHTATLDEIQVDLGEGPGWEAVHSRRPVCEPDLQHGGLTAWPLARQALAATGLGAVFAFPLTIAGMTLGAVNLYSAAPRDLTDTQLREGTILAAIVSRHVLRRALHKASPGDDDEPDWGGDFSRREVHQATGMVLAQLGSTADDALLLLRGHAFAAGRPVRDIAADVIARRLDFSNPTH